MEKTLNHADQLRATIVLRPGGPDPGPALLAGKGPLGKPRGAGPEAERAVQAFVRENGLRVESADEAARTIVVTGSAAQMNDAFGIDLHEFTSEDGCRHRSYDGSIHLPSHISRFVLAVLGLDSRAVAEPRKTGADFPS
jgi:kumamolisin